MAGIAIIGTTDAPEEMINDSLTDLQSQASVEFWVILGITAEAPSCIGTIITWCTDNSVDYDIVVDPAVFAKLDDDVKNGAEKTIKAKDVETKVLERLQEFSGDKLCVLVGDEKPTDAVRAAAAAAHDAGIGVFDLADALVEVEFGDAVADAPEEAPEGPIDWAAKAEEAEAGSDEVQAEMLKAAKAAKMDMDEVDAMSWEDLGTALTESDEEAASAVAKPVKSATKKAAAATASTDVPDTGWTTQLLDAKTLKDLRIIAEQSGIEGGAKMSAKDAKAALLALGNGKATSSSVTGIDTGDVELDHAVQQIVQGLHRFAAVVGHLVK